MDLTALMQKLARTGTRLDSLENAVAAIRGRLRFWQITACVGIGAAVVLFVAWRNTWRRLEQCDKRNRLAA